MFFAAKWFMTLERRDKSYLFFIVLTHLCRPVRSTFAVRETALTQKWVKARLQWDILEHALLEHVRDLKR